jgi:hypothetical protein
LGIKDAPRAGLHGGGTKVNIPGARLLWHKCWVSRTMPPRSGVGCATRESIAGLFRILT